MWDLLFYSLRLYSLKKWDIGKYTWEKLVWMVWNVSDRTCGEPNDDRINRYILNLNVSSVRRVTHHDCCANNEGSRSI